jgi:malate synthase
LTSAQRLLDIRLTSMALARMFLGMNPAHANSHEISWRAELLPQHERVLTGDAVRFVAALSHRFSRRVAERLEVRMLRQAAFDEGDRPDFPRYTRELRASSWNVSAPPADLLDRRVEISGAVDEKAMIDGLESRASSFIADFEDATAPTFTNLVQGQLNLMSAARGTLRRGAAQEGLASPSIERSATLFVRPRGLHLSEKHMLVNGAAVPAPLFDLGLHVFHNARTLSERGSGVYLYLPKLESFLEARLWNDILSHCEHALELPTGTIRATATIESLPAAFEMDEILFELKEHSAGLCFGQSHYVSSFIKKLRCDPAAVLPDRSQLGIDRGFLLACSQLLVRTCHRRGAHAMGGLATQLLPSTVPEASTRLLSRVRADKVREVVLGHDGTRVAHPELVSVAREAFDQHMRGPHQLRRLPTFQPVSPADLLTVPEGTISEAALKNALRVGVAQLQAWLAGSGHVALDERIEDASTAEIACAQVWQWIRHGVRLDTGRLVTRQLVRALLDVETERLAAARYPAGTQPHSFSEACELFDSITCAPELAEFLTVPAYEALLARGL